MRTAMLILALALGASTGACRRHVVVHETPSGAVVIERGHVHTHHCGHFFRRGHWYVAHGHVHGHGCGHHHRDGIWVVVD